MVAVTFTAYNKHMAGEYAPNLEYQTSPCVGRYDAIFRVLDL